MVGIRKRRTKFNEIKTKTMEIKAADVMKLRKMTGAGMMDCKKAVSYTHLTLPTTPYV